MSNPDPEKGYDIAGDVVGDDIAGDVADEFGLIYRLNPSIN